MKKTLLITLLSISSLNVSAKVNRPNHTPAKRSTKEIMKKAEIESFRNQLLGQYKKNLGKKHLKALKKETFAQGGKAVPILIEVMKSNKFPDKNRWLATFLLGRIMGKKASPFISKFLKHPNWVLRMASLKTLLALKDDRFANHYAKSLKDKSLIVRHQALRNIKRLNVKKAAPQVWAMLYDKGNYYVNKKGKRRTNLIKEAIKVVGDLKFEKAQTPLLTMIQKKKYKDIFTEMDYSLSKITGKKSPDGNLSVKRNFWKKVQLSKITI